MNYLESYNHLSVVSSTKKVVILADQGGLNLWKASLIKYILEHPGFSLKAIVLNQSKTTSDSNIIYRLLRKIDTQLFTTTNNQFAKVDFDLSSIPIIKVNPRQTKYSDYFEIADIDSIQALEPDIIIRLGFRILRGNILSIAKYGIWSLHHGDNRINRGGPPGFWEVVNQEPETGVTLQCLTEELDGGRVLDRAFIATDTTSFNRNQNKLFIAGVELFKKNLDRFAAGLLNINSNHENFDPFYVHPLYKNPTAFSSFRISINFIIRSISRRFKSFLFFPQWQIGYNTGKQIEKSLFRYRYLIPPKNTIWADPFIAINGSACYLFAEEKKGTMPGTIVCFTYNPALKKFECPKQVLKTSYHLSYPFVFKYKDDWYMIPESGDAEKVILFKAVEFPWKWEPLKCLFEKKLFDTTLFEHNGLWYAFASVRLQAGSSANDALEIYYTNDPIQGEWKPHALNPVVQDAKSARPAGKIFQYKNQIIRPAQVCIPHYGYAIRFFEIKELSPETFIQHPIISLEPKWDKKIFSTHSFNYEAGISVIDIQKNISRF